MLQLFIGLVISLHEQYEALRKNGDLYMELALTQSRENRNTEMLQKLTHGLGLCCWLSDSCWQLHRHKPGDLQPDSATSNTHGANH